MSLSTPETVMAGNIIDARGSSNLETTSGGASIILDIPMAVSWIFQHVQKYDQKTYWQRQINDPHRKKGQHRRMNSLHGDCILGAFYQ